MKSQKEEEEKAKAAQAKLRRSMEITKENRELQIMSLQEKLREHVSVGCIVQEVVSLYSVLILCKWVDCCLFGVPVVEKILWLIFIHILIKFWMSHVNKIRPKHLECFEMLLTPKSLSPQLAKVQEVCKNSESMSKELEERLIQKYEAYEENRNNQLQSVVKRLQDHVRILEIFISILFFLLLLTAF